MENNPNFYRNLITTDYRLYPLRDTIVVPYEGYAIIRFWATNPGLIVFLFFLLLFLILVRHRLLLFMFLNVPEVDLADENNN